MVVVATNVFPSKYRFDPTSLIAKCKEVHLDIVSVAVPAICGREERVVPATGEVTLLWAEGEGDGAGVA